MHHSKRYLGARKHVDRGRLYSLDEAIDVLRQLPPTRFDQTLDIAARLGVDPRQPEQNLRGTVDLPHGTGKTNVRVIAFAQGEAAREALAAGAIAAGADDLIQRISEGWLDFDAAVAVPEMMPSIARLGRTLGPRGLMPNPRSGTISGDVAALVRAIRGGRIDYRVDRGGVVHAPVGKVSFPPDHLRDNIRSFVDAIVRAKPPSAKGRYLQSLTISPSMGPGVRLDTMQFL
jgi:large subunit ribosomal protein L1